MYAYAEVVGAMFIGLIMFNVCSAWCYNWSHKCMGKVLFTWDIMVMKWFLNMQIAFLAALYWCMLGETFSHLMLFCLIVLRNLPDALLLRMCFLTGIPLSFKCYMILWYALHVSPHVHVFMVSTRMRFPSLAYMTIRYWFIWLDTNMNFTVLSITWFV